MSLNILVTGGLGFIGSHTCVELLNLGHTVIIVDNLSNSKISVIYAIREITQNKGKLCCYINDLNNHDFLEQVFQTHSPINTVMHFAGLKSVNESIHNPLLYYDENISITLNLLRCMKLFECRSIIFSSSSTVYGTPENLPVNENSSVGVNLTSPYGKTKFFQEEILKDLYVADNNMNIILLRYFNPVGAHPSGLIGESPNDVPNNLMPYLLDVATSKRDVLNIYGGDLNTADMTCERDFIHVVDLAIGHCYALKKINEPGVYIYNLGTGKPTSVLELVKTFEKVNNIKLNYNIVGRRQGDVCSIYASANKAFEELGWKTTLGIEEMCIDAFNFVNHNNL